MRVAHGPPSLLPLPPVVFPTWHLLFQNSLGSYFWVLFRARRPLPRPLIANRSSRPRWPSVNLEALGRCSSTSSAYGHCGFWAAARVPSRARQTLAPELRHKGICMPVMFQRGRWLFKTVGKRAFLHWNCPVFTHSWGGHIELIIIFNYNGSLCRIWDLEKCQISSGACVAAHVWFFPSSYDVCVCVNWNTTNIFRELVPNGKVAISSFESSLIVVLRKTTNMYSFFIHITLKTVFCVCSICCTCTDYCKMIIINKWMYSDQSEEDTTNVAISYSL